MRWTALRDWVMSCYLGDFALLFITLHTHTHTQEVNGFSKTLSLHFHCTFSSNTSQFFTCIYLIVWGSVSYCYHKAWCIYYSSLIGWYKSISLAISNIAILQCIDRKTFLPGPNPKPFGGAPAKGLQSALAPPLCLGKGFLYPKRIQIPLNVKRKQTVLLSSRRWWWRSILRWLLAVAGQSFV